MKPSLKLVSRTGLDAPETNRPNRNKKEVTLFFCCISLFNLFSVHAGQHEGFSLLRQPTTTDTLDLEGELATGGIRSGGDVIATGIEYYF